MGNDEGQQGQMVGTVGRIARFPVKSMIGEELDDGLFTTSGLIGDRAYALIDRADGKVASAKNPRKWGRLLEFGARFVEPPTPEAPRPPVLITFADGSEMRSDDPGVDEALSKAIGREVVLADVAPDDRRFEEVWPDIAGLAPEEFIAGNRLPEDEDGRPVSDISLGMAAPPGTFFDLSVVHLLTTSTLEALAAVDPQATFDWRRYRPNLVIDSISDGFVENTWGGSEITIGTVALRGEIPAMRCVMTTLPQPDLPLDRATLRAVAAANRIEIPGLGFWACAGLYAAVAEGGVIRRGDPVVL